MDRGGRGLQPLGESFLAVLERDRQRLQRLCAALERLADGLPGSSAGPQAARLIPFMDKAYDRHIFLHEKCLYPILRSLSSSKAANEPVLKQLEYEHACDHGLMHEITSAYENASGQAGADVCVFGFSLRSFFENCCRHLAWEATILHPIAQGLLADEPAAHHAALLRTSLGFA
jgi:hemerythrin-like domain-containing protein